MIISRICGGLGNQMFQYAAGRRLACKLDTQLKLDKSWFDTINERSLGLQIFNIKATIASAAEISNLTKHNAVKRCLIKMGLSQSKHIWSTASNFEPQILRLGDNVYLDGYWQSEKYFRDTKNVISADFAFKRPASPPNIAVSERIAATNSVSIHIRRGDYIANPANQQKYTQLTSEYYFECVKKMNRLVQNAHYFVFSDDLKWAQSQFGSVADTDIVDINDRENAHEDLRLMSLCRHNIIANSTFSWWGAWLNKNPDKVVLAPEAWFTKAAARRTDDLIPETWIKIK